MKRKRIIAILTYVLLAAAWGTIFVSLFTACNVYEDTRVEITRNPGHDPTPGVGTPGINKGCELNRSLCF